MSDKPLFENMDEQERRYAPEDVPGDERVRADEQGSLSPPSSDEGDTPVAVPLGTGGGLGAVPASDAFDPGMDREEADMARGESVVGPDTRDEQVKPAGSVTQELNRTPPDER